ncbi:hypothetical protein D3C85_1061240 [compost metagenome]
MTRRDRVGGGAQVPALARALRIGGMQAVLVGACVDVAAGQREGVLRGLRGGRRTILCGDDLDAVAARECAQAAEVADLHLGLAAGDGGGAIEHEAVGGAGAVECRAQFEHAVRADVGALDCQRGACGHAGQRHSAAVGQ